MTAKNIFTREEWSTLQFAPLWVFGAVAGADKINKKEIVDLDNRKLKAALGSLLIFKEPMVREVLKSVIVDGPEVVLRFKKDPRDVYTGLQDVAHLLDEKVTPEQAQLFKRALVQIGNFIINSSSGGILNMIFHKQDKMKAALALVTTELALRQ